MNFDRVTAGAISGMTACLFKTFFNQVFQLFSVIEHSYPQLAAHLLAIGHKSYLLGLIVDLVIGGTLGIIIVYLLKVTGIKVLWFKGILFANLIWFFGVIIGLRFIYPSGIDLNFQYVSLVDHWIFGLTTVFLIKKLCPDFH